MFILKMFSYVVCLLCLNICEFVKKTKLCSILCKDVEDVTINERCGSLSYSFFSIRKKYQSIKPYSTQVSLFSLPYIFQTNSVEFFLTLGGRTEMI